MRKRTISSATIAVAASDAKPYRDAEDIRDRLSKQVYRSVLWVATIDSLDGLGKALQPPAD